MTNAEWLQANGNKFSDIYIGHPYEGSGLTLAFQDMALALKDISVIKGIDEPAYAVLKFITCWLDEEYNEKSFNYE